MGEQLGKTAQPFRVNLDVMAVRAAFQGAAGAGPRFVEQHGNVGAQTSYPFARKRTLAANNAVAVQAAHDGAHIELLVGKEGRAHGRTH